MFFLWDGLLEGWLVGRRCGEDLIESEFKQKKVESWQKERETDHSLAMWMELWTQQTYSQYSAGLLS